MFPLYAKDYPLPVIRSFASGIEFYHIEGYKGTILKVRYGEDKLLPKPLEWKKATFDAVVDSIRRTWQARY